MTPTSIQEWLARLIEEKADSIYVRETIDGEVGNYALSSLPVALAIKHTLRLYREGLKGRAIAEGTPSGRCGHCGAALSEDDSLRHMAIDEDEMERLGLVDPEEIGDEHRVFVELCSVCGTRLGIATERECREQAEKWEREEEAKRIQ